MTTVGPLRSTGVTPLPHYYGPLRFPPIQLTELWIPRLPPGYKPQIDGPLRFLVLSFAARCPLPPRWADPLLLLITSRIVLASSSLAD
jgi:hypothetical protein